MALILGLCIVSKLVLLHFDKNATFNKLTLWPYYLLIAYATLCLFQYDFSASSISKEPDEWLTIVNISRSLCMYMAIGV